MSSDLGNVFRILRVLRDEGFVDALTDVENLVADVDERLERVEQVEHDAEQAVREAEAALDAVDERLERFDEMISLLEAKIEAAFSIGFFFFAIDRWGAGDPLLAAGLFGMGLLGASSLAVTIRRLPQVRRLRRAGRYATTRFDEAGSDDGEDGDDESQTAEEPHASNQGTRRED